MQIVAIACNSHACLRKFTPVRRFIVVLILPLLLPALRAGADPWYASDFSEVHVVYAAGASEEILAAAADFVRLWKVATNSEITASTENTGEACVWLGKEVMPPSLVEPDALHGLGPDGFIIRSYSPNRRDRQYHIGPHMVIAGNTDKATHEGVIEFFDRYLGLRWMWPGNAHHLPVTEIPKAELRFQPGFRFREVSYHGMWQKEKGWQEWRSLLHLPPVFQPGIRRYPLDAVPTAAPVDLAAPDNARAVADWIKQHAPSDDAALPQGVRTLLWEDDAGNPVTAWTLNRVPLLDPALDNLEQDSMAAALALAKGVLESLDQPHLLIKLALADSCPMPPEGTQLDARIVVQLSDRACDFSKPLLERHCEENMRFVDALEAWRATGATIFVSHHTGSLHNNITPFPDLQVLRDNLYAFTQYDVQGVMVEGWDYPEVGYAENARLRGYIMARLLWNPDQVLPDLIEEFYGVYYGAAAPHVAAFDKELAKSLELSGEPLRVDAPPTWLRAPQVEAAEAALAMGLKLELPGAIRPRMQELLSTLEYLQLVCPPFEEKDAQGNAITRRVRSRKADDVIQRLEKRGLTRNPRIPLHQIVREDAARVAAN